MTGLRERCRGCECQPAVQRPQRFAHGAAAAEGRAHVGAHLVPVVDQLLRAAVHDGGGVQRRGLVRQVRPIVRARLRRWQEGVRTPCTHTARRNFMPARSEGVLLQRQLIAAQQRGDNVCGRAGTQARLCHKSGVHVSGGHRNSAARTRLSLMSSSDSHWHRLL